MADPVLQPGDQGLDVRRLQLRLGMADADGVFGDGTEAAVEALQRSHGLDPDGVVGPRTWAVVPVVVGKLPGVRGLLSSILPDAEPAPKAPPPPPTPFMQLGRSGNVGRIIEGDIVQAAASMGLQGVDGEAWIHASIDVEAGGRSGFLPAPDSRPIVLFESHQFHVKTGGRFDSVQPNLSTPSWVRNYGPAGAHQWDRLNMAMRLDAEAALESASVGMFQVMGSNYGICNYPDVMSMYRDMATGEPAHLRAYVSFCRKTGAAHWLAQGDAARFSRIYNGPGYQENEYDVKMQEAHDLWVKRLTAMKGA